MVDFSGKFVGKIYHFPWILWGEEIPPFGFPMARPRSKAQRPVGIVGGGWFVTDFMEKFPRVVGPGYLITI